MLNHAVTVHDDKFHLLRDEVFFDLLFWVKLLLFGELRIQICTEFQIDFFLINKSAHVFVNCQQLFVVFFVVVCSI